MNKIKRLALMLALTVASTISAMAQDTYTYVNIDFKDESVVQFQLADKPELTFADDKLNVTAGTEVASYDYATVAGYHFTNEPTAIDQAVKGSLVVRFTDNEHIVIEGNDAFTAVLYDTAGHLIDSRRAAGSATLSLAGQSAGVYVVKVSDGKSFKFLKK